MIFQPGDIILNDKYRVEGLAGRGAFAEVYHVTHLRLNAPRAIKVLRRDMPGVGSDDFARYRERFAFEAQLGAQLDHPNVVKVYDFEEADGELCLVMEYAPGGSLADRLRAGAFPVDATVHLALDLCDGLSLIHERLRAVHRDLKPSNILFGEDGRAKVSDLGLTQAPGDDSRRSSLGTLAGAHPGTPAYMSPEQELTRGFLLPTSDIFSLGCVLFEALTGQPYKAVYGSRVSDHRPDVPAWLDEIVARAVAESPGRVPADDDAPSRRYRLVAGLRADLNRYWLPELARREAEMRKKRAAEERARRAAEAKALKETQARQKVEERARRAAEAKALKETQARQKVEERARQAAEAQALRDAQEKQEAEARAKAEAEAARKAQVEEEARLRREAELRAERAAEARRAAEEADLARLFDEGVAASQRGDWSQAVEAFGEVVQRRPSYARNRSRADKRLAEAQRRLATMGREDSQVRRTDSYAELKRRLAGLRQWRRLPALGVLLLLLVTIVLIGAGIHTGIIPWPSMPTPPTGGPSVLALTPTPTLPTPTRSLPAATPIVTSLALTPTSTSTLEAPTPTWTPTPTASASATASPTKTSTPVLKPMFTVNEGTINVRAGPGTVYPVIGSLAQGQTFEITGRNTTGDWWQFSYSDGSAWVSSDITSSTGDIEKIAVVSSPVLVSTPTVTPAPTNYPLSGKIAFYLAPEWRREGTRPDARQAGIYMLNLKSNERAYLGIWIGQPTLSADGTRLAYTIGAGSEYSEGDIVVVDPTTWQRTQLTQGQSNRSPALSGDGSKIAYVNGFQTIYIWEGERDRNLTTGAYPAWSPDDNWIVYCGVAGDDIRKIPAAGGSPTRLAQIGTTPAWGASHKIAFARDNDIWVMNEDGTGQTRLTNHPGNDYQPAWSPDGTKIVFVSERDGNAELYVMNPDGSNQTRLTNTAEWETHPSWSR